MTFRCCECHKSLQDGEWREKTRKGVICGNCYDRFIRFFGWTEYQAKFINPRPTPAPRRVVSCDCGEERDGEWDTWMSAMGGC